MCYIDLILVQEDVKVQILPSDEADESSVCVYGQNLYCAFHAELGGQNQFK